MAKSLTQSFSNREGSIVQSLVSQLATRKIFRSPFQHFLTSTHPIFFTIPLKLPQDYFALLVCISDLAVKVRSVVQEILKNVRARDITVGDITQIYKIVVNLDNVVGSIIVV